ncbi:MAG: metal ABC transporter ATP-binding protein [Sphaerochaetaceae bacterium]
MQPRQKVALRFDHVAFSYGQFPVLEEVTFHIHVGEFIALVGPNGSGKTTLLRLILGLEQPQKGTVSLFEQHPRDSRNLIGYIPQHAMYDPTFPISVSEVVQMGRMHAFSRKKTVSDNLAVQKAMEQVEITDLANRPYAALSGGQRRRVLVARALATEPGLLILDEPTANMDAESESRLFRTLGNLKGTTTVLIVTHDMGFVSSLTDRVLCIGDHCPTGEGRTVIQHLMGPAGNAPPDLYGGEALEVLHDTEIPGDSCTMEQTLVHLEKLQNPARRSSNE